MENTLTKLRNSNGVYQPLYETIPLKGNIVISNVESFLSNSVTFKMVSTIGLPALLPLNADLKGLNTKETKMKVATFELNDTFKMLEYLEANDTEKKRPVSKRIQDMSGEYPRPIPVIRNLISKDDIGDILVITNNEPEGYNSANIIRSLHCFDYREIKPAKVLKFKK